MNFEKDRHKESKIAVIGMAGKFPQANDVDEFWENVSKGVESIRPLEEKHRARSGVDKSEFEKENYVDAFGWLEAIDSFDYEFFGISRGEAKLRDPQHRLLLELSYQALEDSGQLLKKDKQRVGLFAGIGSSGYFYKNILPNKELTDAWGLHSIALFNEKDFATTFVSYRLGLTGPSVNINTGCSSSLVSIHLGIQSLMSDESDVVLAGAASINSDQEIGYFYCEGGIHPPTPHVKPFDKSARGTIGGSGGGIVALKLLSKAIEDRDYIYGIIEGSAINNDGADKIGYTAPSIDAQTTVLKDALKAADVPKEKITYIETHGTGTVLGDPIEMYALQNAYFEDGNRESACHIGALKANIGHLGASSGVAGLIKVLLSLSHKKIPPCAYFKTLNDQIDFLSPEVNIPTTLLEWKSKEKRFASVSSFGIGGTNAHCIVGESSLPEFEKNDSDQLLVYSAKSLSSLNKYAGKLQSFLTRKTYSSLKQVAYTLSETRPEYNYKGYICVNSQGDIIESSAQPSQEKESSKKVLFTFTGQGAQYHGLAKAMYSRIPVYRKYIDECCSFVSKYNADIAQIFQNDSCDIDIDDTVNSQPLIFITCYAYAKTLNYFGVSADAYLGHSLGEYVGACLSGAFSLEDALKLICKRAQIMSLVQEGGMLSISASMYEVRPHIANTDVDVAAINSSNQIVLSGAKNDLEKIQEAFDKAGVNTRFLKVQGAYHSRVLDKILESFESAVCDINYQPIMTRMLSNLTGSWLEVGEVLDEKYWSKQMRGTVRFSDAIHAAIKSGFNSFIECMPANTLTMITSSIVKEKKIDQVDLISMGSCNLNGERNFQYFLSAIGELWQKGYPVNLSHLYTNNPGICPVPPYQFDALECWVDPLNTYNNKYEAGTDEQFTFDCDNSDESDVEKRLIEIWETCFAKNHISIDDDFFALGGDSLLATKLISRVAEEFDCNIKITDFMKNSTISSLLKILKIECDASSPVSKSKKIVAGVI